jgi:prepilin-type N-terminal cleavage/methylation domain-containing protein
MMIHLDMGTHDYLRGSLRRLNPAHVASKIGHRGFSFVEVMVVALIAGTAMVFLLSLGQANAQMSAINQESMLARQVAMDVIEYYAHNFPEAMVRAKPEPLERDFFAKHPAFSDTLALSPEMAQLWKKMDPQLVMDIDPSVMIETTGLGHPGLHRLVCSVRWQESGGRKAPKTLTLSRLVSETR